LIGPDLYEKFALDYDIRLVRFIRTLGVPVKLHICGNIAPLFDLLRRVEPDILDIDWMVDFGAAVRVFHDLRTAVSGNVDPVAVMLQGSVADVVSGVSHCISVGDEKTMIAAGCEIPAATGAENLIAMNDLLWRN
jgi:uroporphyrinogen-III decarboxylase